MKRLLCSLVLAALLVPLAARAAVDELEEDHQLSLDYVTPHVNWAQPYALGKIRVLYFGWYAGTEARDMVELMQRFDIQADAAFWAQLCDSPECGWHGGAAGVRRILRLLEKPYDCYIFNRVDLAKLPPEAQYKVLKPVTEGAGLVLINSDDARVLKPARQLKPVPAFLAQGDVQRAVGDAFTVKRGRGVRLGARPSIEYKVGWETEYEAWQERLGRAVLWAAGKEPQEQVTITTDAAEVDRAKLPGVGIRVACAGAPAAAKPGKLEVQLRRWDGVTVPLGKPAEGRALSAMLPLLRAGEYHLDAFLRVDGKVAGWNTAPIKVTSARNVSEVALQRNWGEVGDKIAGIVKLAGPPQPGDNLRVQLVDAGGRILAQQEQMLTGGQTAFEMPTADWMPMLLRVEGVLTRGGQEVSSAYQYYRITHRNRGRWNFVVWDSPNGASAPWAEKALADLGCSGHLYGGAPSLLAAANGIAQVPYTTRLLDDKDPNGVTRPFCWNDKAAVKKMVDDLARAYQPTREHGCFVYSLGDEGVTRGSCLSPYCLEAYQGYLKQEYGDIAALNASWGTKYGGFGEVALSKPDDNLEQQALRDHNYARWFDRQAFQSYNLVQYCGKYKDAFAVLDPEAKTGFEGTGTLQDGDDFDLIVRNNTFWSPYPGPGDEIIRSIAPRDFPRSNWMGYTRDADSLLSKYWRMVTRGMDSVWWWRWDSAPPFRGLIAPYGGPYAAVRDIANDTRRIREGLGTLLLRSKMQDDGIALLYSLPSAYANKVEAGPTYGTYEGAHVACYDLIRGARLQFGYVTDRQMRLGEFDPKRWKILVLAQAEAIGDKEAQVIRDYVQQGGTVIADVRPGIYDGHCKPRATGVLDDLFGVKQSGNKPAVTADLAGPGLRLKAIKINPNVTLAGGTAIANSGATPLYITHQYGKGRAVLLNGAVSSFPRLAASDTDSAMYSLAPIVLAAAGPPNARINLLTPEGRPERNCEVVRWINGDEEIVALFREAGAKSEARLMLPSQRHVYDLRAGKYLGSTWQVPVTIVPSRATFLVLTHSPMAAPQISLGSSTVKPGQVVTAKITAPGAGGEHAVRVRVATPDGKPAEWLNQYVMVGKQGGTCALPIAYNDPAGTWTVSVSDVCSDKASEAKLIVK